MNSHTRDLLYPAMLTLRSQLKDTELIERTRVATRRLYQELIDAEVSEMLGSLLHGRRRAHRVSKRRLAEASD